MVGLGVESSAARPGARQCPGAPLRHRGAAGIGLQRRWSTPYRRRPRRHPGVRLRDHRDAASHRHHRTHPLVNPFVLREVYLRGLRAAGRLSQALALAEDDPPGPSGVAPHWQTIERITSPKLEKPPASSLPPRPRSARRSPPPRSTGSRTRSSAPYARPTAPSPPSKTRNRRCLGRFRQRRVLDDHLACRGHVLHRLGCERAGGEV